MAVSKICLLSFLVCFIALAASAPGPVVEKVPQLLSKQFKTGENSYEYGYQLDDGTSVFAHGELNHVNDEEVYVVTGHYEYKTPDGMVHKVEYIAGPEGFHIIKPTKL